MHDKHLKQLQQCAERCRAHAASANHFTSQTWRRGYVRVAERNVHYCVHVVMQLMQNK